MPYDVSNVSANVKLVIWDLDETFWSGTLSEGGMTPIRANIDMVRTLAERGIMSSICSKNDFETAKAELVKLGIFDMFVFCHIDWTPKGQAIQSIIERAQLRAENVVFLDDNHMNLEEAVFFNPDLMCVDGRLDLTVLLELPQFKGKDDRDLTRLIQYKQLEAKEAEKGALKLSNTDFLRQSDIKIRVITDIDQQMDRVLELINRTNQLNYTKKRANTAEEKAELDALLATSGVHAGLIHAKDRYGEYGIVGFFAVRTKYSGTTVHHFCFSCRTLNMGVEQWVWDYLGRPEFEIAGPVANPIRTFDKIDWITDISGTAEGDEEGTTPNRRLCLVGGCDLLQVSFYCGTNRDEFVNTQSDDNYLVRYDDVGFFLNPRHRMKRDRIHRKLPTWSYEDMLRLDESLANADVMLLSLYFSVPGDNLFTFGGNIWGGEFYATVPIRTLRKLMKSDLALWFAKMFYHRRLPMDERIALTEKCLQKAVDTSRPDAKVFVLGAATEHGQQAERTIEIRKPYNAMCRAFCERHEKAIFIDVDRLLEPEEFADSDHYTRTGYYKIAEFVNANG